VIKKKNSRPVGHRSYSTAALPPRQACGSCGRLGAGGGDPEGKDSTPTLASGDSPKALCGAGALFRAMSPSEVALTTVLHRLASTQARPLHEDRNGQSNSAPPRLKARRLAIYEKPAPSPIPVRTGLSPAGSGHHPRGPPLADLGVDHTAAIRRPAIGKRAVAAMAAPNRLRSSQPSLSATRMPTRNLGTLYAAAPEYGVQSRSSIPTPERLGAWAIALAQKCRRAQAQHPRPPPGLPQSGARAGGRFFAPRLERAPGPSTVVVGWRSDWPPPSLTTRTIELKPRPTSLPYVNPAPTPGDAFCFWRGRSSKIAVRIRPRSSSNQGRRHPPARGHRPDSFNLSQPNEVQSSNFPWAAAFEIGRSRSTPADRPPTKRTRRRFRSLCANKRRSPFPGPNWTAQTPTRSRCWARENLAWQAEGEESCVTIPRGREKSPVGIDAAHAPLSRTSTPHCCRRATELACASAPPAVALLGQSWTIAQASP